MVGERSKVKLTAQEQVLCVTTTKFIAVVYLSLICACFFRCVCRWCSRFGRQNVASATLLRGECTLQMIVSFTNG